MSDRDNDGNHLQHDQVMVWVAGSPARPAGDHPGAASASAMTFSNP